MPASDWTPPTVDLDRPSAARVYDYLLGGHHNYAIDREHAEEVLAVVPFARDAARANRAWLGRVTRWLAQEAGITQFLDIGCGIPAMGAVHEVAQAVNPECRVVYVDNEPVAFSHAQLIAERSEHAGSIQAIHGDLRDPDSFLSQITLLDPEVPIAVILAAVLHFVPDSDDPAGILASIKRALPAGSYIALSHGTADSRQAEIGEAAALYERAQNQAHVRTWDEIWALLPGLEMVEPGLDWVPEWFPDDGPIPPDAGPASCLYGALGKVRPLSLEVARAVARHALEDALAKADGVDGSLADRARWNTP